ncbi:MAG: hypothetical protein LBR66_00850 [Candidatus Symbiothrix sp.]|nr:hypothetical protein [Candidatus Symbiothrix sp.]
MEVDFVVTDKDGYTSYYQVAWTTMQPETLERYFVLLVSQKCCSFVVDKKQTEAHILL